MASALIVLAFLTFASLSWTPADGQYYTPIVHDGFFFTFKRISWKLRKLAEELVHDVEGKVDAIQHYRDQYHKSLQYQLGDMVYDTRYLFRQMVYMYQRTDKVVAYNHLDHNENIRRFIIVLRMGMELESKVVMIQEWQKKQESRQDLIDRMNSPLRSGANRENDELENEPLHEQVVRNRMAMRAAAFDAPAAVAAARVLPRVTPQVPPRAAARMLRRAAARVPPHDAARLLPRAPRRGVNGKRNNKKWSNDFYRGR